MASNSSSITSNSSTFESASDTYDKGFEDPNDEVAAGTRDWSFGHGSAGDPAAIVILVLILLTALLLICFVYFTCKRCCLYFQHLAGTSRTEAHHSPSTKASKQQPSVGTSDSTTTSGLSENADSFTRSREQISAECILSVDACSAV
eukprot:4877765-Pleurochrysis_carterae.AAC.5